MDKSPGAFRTISEVADDLNLPQHVLRFWETKFNQIKPMKRGGGRRYYRPTEVDLLRGIRHLLYTEGYTIKGVQKILREQGARHVLNSFLEQDSEPENEGIQQPVSVAPVVGVPTKSVEAKAPPTPGINEAKQQKFSKRTLQNLKSALSELKEVRQLAIDAQSG